MVYLQWKAMNSFIDVVLRGKEERKKEFERRIGGLEPVMSEYHKMDTNEYPNIFGCHIRYRMNIRIYSDATYLPNEYPNIFVFRK